MSERYHLWMINSDKLGKDERLHFTFGTMQNLAVFIQDWVSHSAKNKTFQIIVEVTKK